MMRDTNFKHSSTLGTLYGFDINNSPNKSFNYGRSFDRDQNDPSKIAFNYSNATTPKKGSQHDDEMISNEMKSIEGGATVTSRSPVLSTNYCLVWFIFRLSYINVNGSHTRRELRSAARFESNAHIYHFYLWYNID